MVEHLDKRLKILLVHERFPPEYAGGGEYVVLETAKHLQALGHQVSVLTTGDPAQLEYQGIRTRRLPLSRYRLNLAWREVEEAAEDVDVINAFTYHAVYPAYRAGLRLGKPVVCGVLALFGDAWLEMKGPLLGRLFRAFESYLLRLPVAKALFLSDFSRDMAVSMGLGTNPHAVVEPGISHDDYRPAPDKSYVLFSGKLGVRKGIDKVLGVARALPEVPFRIIGWGEQYEHFRSMLPANVVMEPFRDRGQLAQSLAHARIFLFPTKAETFGLIVAEAMASGCAVISTSPLPYAGMRVSDGDEAELVKAVQSLWQDEERCHQMGEENLKRARRYDWQRHARELSDIYHQVTNRNRKPS